MDDIICNLARRFGKLGHKNSPYRFKNRLNGTHMQLCLENDVQYYSTVFGSCACSILMYETVHGLEGKKVIHFTLSYH